MCVEFSKNRSSLPPVVLFTPHETSLSIWTSSTSPSLPVLDRLVKLADVTLAEISSMMLNERVCNDQEDIKVSAYDNHFQSALTSIPSYSLHLSNSLDMCCVVILLLFC